MTRIKPSLIVFLLSNFIAFVSLHGQDSLEESFLPHMLDHPIVGCPINSTCSEKAGSIRKSWANFMNSIKEDKDKTKKIESYRQKNGIPIDVWLLDQSSAKDFVISWDSYCSQHQKEDNSLAYIGEIFLSDLNLIPKEAKEQVLFEEAYLLNNSKIIRYKTPRGDYPVAIGRDSSLIFIREEEGEYYGIKIGEKGTLSVVPIPSMKGLFPVSINCPKEFLPILQEQTKLKELLSDTNCKNVYHFALKKMLPMMFYKSCR